MNDIGDAEAQQFMDMMTSLGYVQQVKFDTHKQGYTIDLVYLEEGELDADNTICTECKGIPFLSNHRIVPFL